MIMKEIDNANTAKANITRGSVYTINKYTLANTSNTFRITQQQQACGTNKYENAHTQAFVIEFSRRRDHEPSALRTFWRLKMWLYKRETVSSNF